MFSDPYYHQTTKRIVSAFGMMFNNINIIREDENRNEVNRFKVPLAYHAKKAWHRILKEHSDGDENLTSLQGYFPRLSYNIVDIQPLREKQSQAKMIVREDGQGLKTFTQRTPYRILFELGVYTKKQEDMYKILEQILPYFTPSLAFSIYPSREMTTSLSEDFVLNLESIAIDDNLELDFESAYNLQIYNRILSFSVDMYYYGPETSASGVIKTATTTFYQANTGKPMSKVVVEVDPPDAEVTSFGISCGGMILDEDFNFNTAGIITSGSG